MASPSKAVDEAIRALAAARFQTRELQALIDADDRQNLLRAAEEEASAQRLIKSLEQVRQCANAGFTASRRPFYLICATATLVLHGVFVQSQDILRKRKKQVSADLQAALQAAAAATAAAAKSAGGPAVENADVVDLQVSGRTIGISRRPMSWTAMSTYVRAAP
jgi:hypothetical protein